MERQALIYAVIALAGAAGALIRYGIGAAIPFNPADSFPYATLFTNCAGCLFLGWFLTTAGYRATWNPALKTGIATGLVGSFTTFSTFSVETVRLGVEAGRWGTAVVYVLLSIWCGIALAWLGHRLAEYGHNRRRHGGVAP
jgi:fluoride exporter